MFTLTTINAWNRLAITMRTEVGNYQPKARPVSQTAVFEDGRSSRSLLLAWLGPVCMKIEMRRSG